MDIDGWRARIDELDLEILRLLNRRAECARNIGRLKGERGMEVHAPEREAEILSRVVAENRGPLNDEMVVQIFKVVIEESRRIESGEGL